MNTLADKTEVFKREQLAIILTECSEAQQTLFRRIFPNGVPTDKLDSAYDLVERTIKKNIANPSRLER